MSSSRTTYYDQKNYNKRVLRTTKKANAKAVESDTSEDWAVFAATSSASSSSRATSEVATEMSSSSSSSSSPSYADEDEDSFPQQRQQRQRQQQQRQRQRRDDNNKKVRTFYTFKPGETVEMLAEYIGVDVSKLKELNPNVDLDFVFPGDRVVVHVQSAPPQEIFEENVAKDGRAVIAQRKKEKKQQEKNQQHHQQQQKIQVQAKKMQRAPILISGTAVILASSVPAFLALSKRFGYLDMALTVSRDTLQKMQDVGQMLRSSASQMLEQRRSVFETMTTTTSNNNDNIGEEESSWRLKSPDIYAAMTKPLGALNSNNAAGSPSASSSSSFSTISTDSEQEIKDLRKELIGMKAKLAVTDGEARTVKSQLEGAKAEREKIANEAKKIESEANDIRTQLENAKNEKKKLADEMKQKEAEMNESLRDAQQSAEAEMKRTLEESIKKNEKLQRDLELARDSLRQSQASRESELNSMKLVIKQMEGELQEEKSILISLKEESSLRAESEQKEISELEKSLSEKLKREKTLQSEINRLENDLSANETELKEATSLKEDAISALKTIESKSREEIDSLSAEGQKMKLEIIAFNQRVMKLESEADIASKRAEDAAEALERIQQSADATTGTLEEKLSAALLVQAETEAKRMELESRFNLQTGDFMTTKSGLENRIEQLVNELSSIEVQKTNEIKISESKAFDLEAKLAEAFEIANLEKKSLKDELASISLSKDSLEMKFYELKEQSSKEMDDLGVEQRAMVSEIQNLTEELASKDFLELEAQRLRDEKEKLSSELDSVRSSRDNLESEFDRFRIKANADLREKTVLREADLKQLEDEVRQFADDKKLLSEEVTALKQRLVFADIAVSRSQLQRSELVDVKIRELEYALKNVEKEKEELKSEFDERLNRQNTEYAALARDMELQIKETEDEIELSKESLNKELNAALESKEEAEENEKAWREKIKELELMLATYTDDTEKELESYREKMSSTELDLQEAFKLIKKLEAEEIEAKASQMSSHEKIVELESKLAEQSDIEQELKSLREKISSKEIDLEEALEKSKNFESLKAELADANENLEILRIEAKAEIDDAWRERDEATADIYRERAKGSEALNILEKELNEKIDDFQKQLESAIENHRMTEENLENVKVDKLAMELVIARYREDSDKFRSLSEEFESAMRVQASAEQILNETKENFNKMLECSLSEHKQEIQTLGNQYDLKVEALETKLKSLRDQNFEESKKAEVAELRVVSLESELEEVRSKIDAELASSVSTLSVAAAEAEDLKRQLDEVRSHLESSQEKFESELGAAMEAREIAEYNLQTATEKISNFENELLMLSNDRNAEIEELRGKINEMKESNQEQEQCLKMELEESRSELESARTNFEAELNAAYEAQRSAESRVEEMNDQIKSYESELSAVSGLELQIDDLEMKLSEYDTSSDEMQIKLEATLFDLENSESKVAAAEEKLSQSEKILEDLRSNIEEMESNLNGRNSTVQNLENRLIESEQSRTDLENARIQFEKELSVARHEKKNAELSVESANDRVKAMESELETLRVRIEKFEAQSQEKENLLEEEARKLRVKVEELENAEQRLEQQVIEAKDFLSDAENRARSSEESLLELQLERAALLQEQNVLQDEKLKIQGQLTDLETKKQRVDIERSMLPFSVDAKFCMHLDLPPNQLLALTGSWCEWKVTSSEEMLWVNNSWMRDVSLGVDFVHEYKYVICERDDTGSPAKQIEWQKGSNNLFGASSESLKNMRGDLEIHDTFLPNPANNPIYVFTKSGGKFETGKSEMIADCLRSIQNRSSSSEESFSLDADIFLVDNFQLSDEGGDDIVTINI